MEWGTLDYLIIDTPPGTSDEHISIVQYLKEAAGVEGAVVVTTPQVRRRGYSGRFGCAAPYIVCKLAEVNPSMCVGGLTDSVGSE